MEKPSTKLRSEEVLPGTRAEDHVQKVPFFLATDFGAGDMMAGCDRNFRILCFLRFVLPDLLAATGTMTRSTMNWKLVAPHGRHSHSMTI